MARTVPHTTRTTVRRQRQKASYDEATVHAIVDAQPWCHLAVTVVGLAMAIPTIAVRDGDVLYLHGSRRSTAILAALAAEQVAVTFTLIDGLLVATTGFEHSIAFRTVVVVGTPSAVSGAAKRRALDLLVDAVLPGRSHELPEATPRELAATTVLRVDLTEAVAKVSVGPPDARATPGHGAVWAGEVPLEQRYGNPTDTTVGVDLPASVRRLLREQP